MSRSGLADLDDISGDDELLILATDEDLESEVYLMTGASDLHSDSDGDDYEADFRNNGDNTNTINCKARNGSDLANLVTNKAVGKDEESAE